MPPAPQCHAVWPQPGGSLRQAVETTRPSAARTRSAKPAMKRGSRPDRRHPHIGGHAAALGELGGTRCRARPASRSAPTRRRSGRPPRRRPSRPRRDRSASVDGSDPLQRPDPALVADQPVESGAAPSARATAAPCARPATGRDRRARRSSSAGRGPRTAARRARPPASSRPAAIGIGACASTKPALVGIAADRPRRRRQALPLVLPRSRPCSDEPVVVVENCG